VDYWVDTIGPVSEAEVLKQHDITCKLAEWASGQKKNDLTIFPNDPDIGTNSFSFREPPTKFRMMVGGPYNPSTEYYLMPIAIGCLAYKSTISETFRHTWFSYRFMGTRDDGFVEWIKESDWNQPYPRIIEKSKVKVRLGNPWGRNTGD
jgi:hypothetical protein